MIKEKPLVVNGRRMDLDDYLDELEALSARFGDPDWSYPLDSDDEDEPLWEYPLC